MNETEWQGLYDKIDSVRLVSGIGKIHRIVGLLIESVGPEVSLGEICHIIGKNEERITAEVIGFNEELVTLMPYGPILGIAPGSKVIATGQSLRVKVGNAVLGRVISPLGRPMDNLGKIDTNEFYEVDNDPPNPMSRPTIKEVLPMGVRAIDSCITCGMGQRIGVFAGSGVGKSTLMGMIARNTAAEVNVIALIGERGREVQEFIQEALGEEGLKRSVLIIATSDQPAIVRLKGAFVATAIAEYFRDQGKNVMLMMDSVTRFALAQREVGLAAGETPTNRGYPASVFALMPRLFERAGTNEKGSITGIYTVLVEGGDMDEPIADAVRGLLDGHIVMSRDLAHQGHFPAINVMESVSRLMLSISDDRHRELQIQLRELLANYEKSRDLIDIGAYQAGSNAKTDLAIAKIDQINAFLKQGTHEYVSFDEMKNQLAGVMQ
ncbi:MAG: flagellar protein export ATPase FliI [Candidatus Cloacimonadota bacterium]|nr:MAG: flagellar protein export ATPase FliI [Candidatus Cloacimonadota bacterium]